MWHISAKPASYSALPRLTVAYCLLFCFDRTPGTVFQRRAERLPAAHWQTRSRVRARHPASCLCPIGRLHELALGEDCCFTSKHCQDAFPILLSIFNVFQQDYHPQGHISFVTSHPGCEHKAFQSIEVHTPQREEIDQILWPEHCVGLRPLTAVVSGLTISLPGRTLDSRDARMRAGSDCTRSFRALAEGRPIPPHSEGTDTNIYVLANNDD